MLPAEIKILDSSEAPPAMRKWRKAGIKSMLWGTDTVSLETERGMFACLET